MRSVILVAVVVAAGCGDDASGNGALSDTADAAGGAIDAQAGIDAADIDAAGAVIVFDNADRTFVWTPYWFYDDESNGPGAYLDLTNDAASQGGEPSPSGLRFFKRYPEQLSTWGGFYIQGSGATGARQAAGDDLVLDGSDWDITVVPAALKSPGDLVGPDDRWVIDDSGFGEYRGVKTLHLQDEGSQTAPDQALFTAGVIGVQFDGDDGVHYAFVELSWEPGDSLQDALHVPLRWGYNPVADQPLVIPP